MSDHMKKLADLRRTIDKEYYRLKYLKIPNEKSFKAVGLRAMSEIAGLRETVIYTEFELTTSENTPNVEREAYLVQGLEATYYMCVKPHVSRFYTMVYDYMKGKNK